jgi:hypothetical protein
MKPYEFLKDTDKTLYDHLDSASPHSYDEELMDKFRNTEGMLVSKRTLFKTPLQNSPKGKNELFAHKSFQCHFFGTVQKNEMVVGAYCTFRAPK